MWMLLERSSCSLVGVVYLMLRMNFLVDGGRRSSLGTWSACRLRSWSWSTRSICSLICSCPGGLVLECLETGLDCLRLGSSHFSLDCLLCIPRSVFSRLPTNTIGFTSRSYYILQSSLDQVHGLKLLPVALWSLLFTCDLRPTSLILIK